MKLTLILLCLVYSALLSTAQAAEVAVIVHANSSVSALSEDDIRRIFLGKGKTFPNGEPVISINQSEGSGIRDKFNDVIVKKSASQYKAYWSQLVFTGKGTPPKDVGNDADVKKLIAANPSMMGYIDAAAVDSSVKVVFKIP